MERSFAGKLWISTKEAGLRKGERTRRTLKAACAELLEKQGYGELRVNDIIERAGVSNALFYVYFEHKQELTFEILSEFLATLRPNLSLSRDKGIAEATFASNLLYVRQFRENAGLMRCLLQFGDEVEQFAILWQDFNARWMDRVIRATTADPDIVVANQAERLVICASLGMMVDGLLRLAFIDRSRRLQSEGLEVIGDDAALALLLTRLWHRALYARELDWSPDPASIEQYLKLL
jgi:TetR/AcrR family transcriptional regulator, transcriptional repressor for nem operon